MRLTHLFDLEVQCEDNPEVHIRLLEACSNAANTVSARLGIRYNIILKDVVTHTGLTGTTTIASFAVSGGGATLAIVFVPNEEIRCKAYVEGLLAGLILSSGHKII